MYVLGMIIGGLIPTMIIVFFTNLVLRKLTPIARYKRISISSIVAWILCTILAGYGNMDGKAEPVFTEMFILYGVSIAVFLLVYMLFSKEKPQT